MSNDLIRRYIYAVTYHLPRKAQPEVELEISSMVSELLEARCGGAKPSDADVRALLTELGPPEDLAIKYSGEEDRALISGIYFLWFKKTLKIVLPIAAVGVAFATLLTALITWRSPQEASNFNPEIIGEVLSGAIGAAVQAFTWVTIVFAILSRQRVKLTEGDFLAKLPPVPDRRAQIKIHEPVINVLWHIAVAVLLLGFPHLIGGYSDSAGWIPAFSESHIRASWYLIAMWVTFGIAYEMAKLFERRYSVRLALITVVSHIFIAILAALFFANNSIVNPAFAENASSMLKGASAEKIGWALGHVNLVILGIMLFALLINTATTTYRAIRYGKYR